MTNSIRFLRKARWFTTALIAAFLVQTTVWAAHVTIPVNTRIYVETLEPVSGKKKNTQEGQVVRAAVWRDVTIDNVVVIRAGTPVLVRVDSIKGAKVAGVKGKMTLGAYETHLIDETLVPLSGGYYKEGKGRVALTASLAAFVFLPLIFIKGKAANLPSGTVFDAYTDRAIPVEIPDAVAAPADHVVDLTAMMDRSFNAEVLYDELEAADKPEVFAFAIQAPAGNSGRFVIDTLNGVAIDALALDAHQTGSDEELEFWRGEIKIKDIAKMLKKGINTFEIATTIDGQRVAKEVVLDVQI